MPFCVNCGSELRPGAKFCSQCGARARLPTRHVSRGARRVSQQVSPRPASHRPEVPISRSLDELESLIQEYETLLAQEPAIDQQIQKLTRELALIEKEIRRIVRIRAREELDVRELEGLSWKSIKAMFRGDLQQLKEKEQREYLAALAKEKEVKQERVNITRKLEQLKEEKRKIQRIKHELPSLRLQLEQQQARMLNEVPTAATVIETRQSLQEVQLEKTLHELEQEHIENALQALNTAKKHLDKVLHKIETVELTHQDQVSAEHVAELFAKEPLVSTRQEILYTQQALRQASMELLAIDKGQKSAVSIPDFSYQQLIDLMIDEALAGKGFNKTKLELQKIQQQITEAITGLSPTQTLITEKLTRVKEKEQEQKQKLETAFPSSELHPSVTEKKITVQPSTPTTSLTTENAITTPPIQDTTPEISKIPKESDFLGELYQELDKISYRFNKMYRENDSLVTEFSTGAIETARWSISNSGELNIIFTGKELSKTVDIVLEKPSEETLPPYDWLNPFAGMQITASERIQYRLKQETQLAENIRKISNPLIIKIRTSPNVSGELIVKNFSLEDVDNIVQIIKDLGWSIELTL